MSYILNALRKSEQERQSKRPESVTDRILVQAPARKPGTVRWIVLAIIGNAVIIAGIVRYTQKTPFPIAADPAPLSLALPAVVADGEPVDRPKTKIIEAPTISENRSIPNPPPSAKRLATSKAQDNQVKSPAPAIPKSPPVSMTGSADRTDKASSTGTPAPSIQRRQLAAKLSETASADEKLPAPEPQTPNSIPYLSELPYDFRQTVPKMAINVFVYSTDPAERFVIINMVKYKSGQQTKDQVDIKDILPKSLVLSYRDLTFQIAQP